MRFEKDSGINLYEGYQRLLKKEKADGNKKPAAMIPLVLIALVMAAFSLYFVVQNAQKQGTVNRLETDKTNLQPRYDAAKQLTDQFGALNEVHQNLLGSDLLFNIYPLLTRTIIERVQVLAGTTFGITAYGYDETTGTLTLSAEAPSVNDVPNFIRSLRNTGLFESVQYAGYTSDTTGTYYCTVGCMLDTSAMEGLTDALTGAAGAETAETDQAAGGQAAPDDLESMA
jgi:hypothetical protein